MNSDYVLKGKGQIALHQPDWARFTPSSGARDVGSASTPQSTSALPTQKHAQIPGQKTAAANHAAQDEDTQPSKQVRTAQRMNEFTHSGSKKSVGPDVDTVDYTFEDFLDTINPLQQIPIVNMIYRELTGDKISGVAAVTGSALYWGPMGIVTGAIDAIVEQEKGGSMGETIVAGLFGNEPPRAKHLPSNNPIKNAPDTMLADAGKPELADEDAATPVAVAEAKPAPAPHHKVATKQPFGGVMGTEPPAPSPTMAPTMASTTAEPAPNDDVAETPDDDRQATKPAPGSVATPPVQHAPVDADGHKMYSLAGVIRHVGSPAKMPPREIPDARLKSYETITAKPKQDPATLLGLQNPAASIATAPTLDDGDMPATRLPDPGFSAPLTMDSMTPSGNPIPAQLIQDMMMMNMQKYQNDMQNGRLRGNGVDING